MEGVILRMSLQLSFFLPVSNHLKVAAYNPGLKTKDPVYYKKKKINKHPLFNNLYKVMSWKFMVVVLTSYLQTTQYGGGLYQPARSLSGK